MMKQFTRFSILILAAALVLTVSAHANEDKTNLVRDELLRIKYNYALSASAGTIGLEDFDDPDGESMAGDVKSGYKSPGKAFLLSLAVPGLGQYYYGSRIKPIAFLGVEAASWILHVSWHNKGEELTDEFEAFNQTHWSRTRYEDYLEIAYGVRDDDAIPDSVPHTEVSHSLPDTRTQQYYEMTGKYNQFAWGWDDATLNGMTHNDFDSAAEFPPPITSQAVTPNSANRFLYETMRNDANKKLDNANKMIMVVLANHLISAVEAYIATKSKNGSGKKGTEFSNFKFKPSLKSYNERSDTPYMSVTWKF